MGARHPSGSVGEVRIILFTERYFLEVALFSPKVVNQTTTDRKPHGPACVGTSKTEGCACSMWVTMGNTQAFSGLLWWGRRAASCNDTLVHVDDL